MERRDRKDVRLIFVGVDIESGRGVRSNADVTAENSSKIPQKWQTTEAVSTRRKAERKERTLARSTISMIVFPKHNKLFVIQCCV